MSDVLGALYSLDEKDMERVNRLILKLASNKNKHGNSKLVLPDDYKAEPEESAEIPAKNLDEQRVSDKVKQPRRIETKKKGRRGEEEVPARRGQTPKGQQKRKKYASNEPIDTSGGRPNKFLEMMEAKTKNVDREADLALAGKNAPIPRMGRKIEKVSIDCAECGDEFIVLASQVYMHPEDGPTYICNDCSASKGRGRGN